MKFLLVATFITAVSAVPIPQTQIVSPYMTRFTERTTVTHRIRNAAAGLVSKIPEVLSIKRAADDDIFLARALEDTVFASAHDIITQRSYLKPVALPERALTSDDSTIQI
ncbi:hypothetical protein DFH08DRAFT_941660 [Mycena albidolilacea]|uniref:Uncharacterized protein n=1 Tax=Mycena albidolilacea TaxID=1033008 RepID=A0AAD6ZHM5_9AGAR|nr:hypothetical protein DFH08DRAFT_941660 [Mycena albidolilacea]